MWGQGPRGDREWDNAKNFNNTMEKSILSMILPSSGDSLYSVSSSVKWRQSSHRIVVRNKLDKACHSPKHHLEVQQIPDKW